MPAPAQAEEPAQEAVDIMGDWTVRPVPLERYPCIYRQWVSVDRELGMNRYAGTARWRYECANGLRMTSSTPVELTVRGRQVTITSDRSNWSPETLEYRSPELMVGGDEIGRELIYERRARPGV